MARRGEVDLIVSRETVEEFARVLAYPKFGLSAVEIAEILADLRAFAEYVELDETVAAISEDPTDNVFLALARAGRATHIVSGDHHLLDLGSFEGVRILSVRAFIEQVRTA